MVGALRDKGELCWGRVRSRRVLPRFAIREPRGQPSLVCVFVEQGPIRIGPAPGYHYRMTHTPCSSRTRGIPLEALGGIGRRGARCLRFLARRAKDRKRGRDGTRYSRFHPANFLSHHLAKIVSAAVYTDAQHIEDGINYLKQRAHDLALDDAAAP